MSTQPPEANNELNTLDFEAAVRQNSEPYWSARWLSQVLGYADFSSFRQVMDRAMRACNILNIPTVDHFRASASTVVDDIKLSRFASYLIVLNADSSEEPVANAQVYLAGLAAVMRAPRESRSDHCGRRRKDPLVDVELAWSDQLKTIDALK